MTERRFQNYPVRVNGEGEMELLAAPAAVAPAAPAAPAAASLAAPTAPAAPAPTAPAPFPIAPTKKDVIDLTMHSNSEFAAALAAGEFTKDSDSEFGSQSDSSDEDSVSSVESDAYFSCNEFMPPNYVSGDHDSGYDSVAGLCTELWTAILNSILADGPIIYLAGLVALI